MRVILLAVALALSCTRGPAPLLTEVLGAFEDEVDVAFRDCGGGIATCATASGASQPTQEFVLAGQCLLDAWVDCQPAKAILERRDPETSRVSSQYIFVVPDAGSRMSACHLALFEERPPGEESPRLVDRFRCEDLLEQDSCDVVGPESCSLVETIAYLHHPGG